MSDKPCQKERDEFIKATRELSLAPKNVRSLTTDQIEKAERIKADDLLKTHEEGHKIQKRYNDALKALEECEKLWNLK